MKRTYSTRAILLIAGAIFVAAYLAASTAERTLCTLLVKNCT